MNQSGGPEYEGALLDGKKHGKGVLTCANGDTFSGNWNNDIFVNGVIEFSNGCTFRGICLEGKMKFGKLEYPNKDRIRGAGDYYVGNFEGLKEHGHGTMSYSDGYRYEGEWRHGKKHGQGTAYSPNGDRFDGEWSEDEIISGELTESKPGPDPHPTGNYMCWNCHMVRVLEHPPEWKYPPCETCGNGMTHMKPPKPQHWFWEMIDILMSGGPLPSQQSQSSGSGSFYDTHRYRCFCGHVQIFDRPQTNPGCPSCGGVMWRT